ncbi:ATP-binding cassette domain-containing protein [Kurthia sp. YJT4]|uniref:ABC transporter ATP-binding protein n=1 Tax=Kurthia sp. YJT4 TaxID=3049086 RepID=UPI00254EF61C|nr:ABC transporter ATP-binding protein [Kurthia sp. YJT4]WIL40114.1 ATP-binding cassette domain-containing protein [Kurthia sp. YJT4]
MALIEINQLTFSYPLATKPTLKNISLEIEAGEFVVLCGTSGCGKSTLLKHLKRELTPHGQMSGTIHFNGVALQDLPQREAASQIGYVLQKPELQIVTDKVWHELSFGLENLGYDSMTIRRRVAEMASFFGIQTWFRKNTTDLSGGQKQLLNLASIMVMQPQLLVLDEPTSQLDPIAASEFIATLQKLNKELGLTIVLVEHRLEEVYPIADRVIILDAGEIIANDTPIKAATRLRHVDAHHPMLLGLPTPLRVHHALKQSDETPLTIRDGRTWLEKHYEKDHKQIQEAESSGEVVLDVQDVWFRYDRHAEDLIRGLNFQLHQGEFLSIVGGNGTGKSTTLGLITGLLKPHRGKVTIFNKPLKKYAKKELYQGMISMLPQDPTTLLVEKEVQLELAMMSKDQAAIDRVIDLLQIRHLLAQHPYDLSGGEQQKVALGKVLLKNPKILVLDEPTKGLDGESKQVLARILHDLQSQGTSILMVTHDVEFSAEHATSCAMFFDGEIVAKGTPAAFYSGNHFYTTATNRMCRQLFEDVVTTEQLIARCQSLQEVMTHV